MLLSEKIARMMEEMLNAGDGTLEIGRNDLAGQLGCVPSQINYVISSRFTAEKGYLVESRRGGGGYIRITRLAMERNPYLMHALSAVGESIDASSAAAFIREWVSRGEITPSEGGLIAASVSDRALAKIGPDARDVIRADILKSQIYSLID